VKAGFYSPLPPARSGVADYSAALLGELRRGADTHGSIEVAPNRCDVALYHLGNNALHADVYRRALEIPGVVVLHDSVLHHFLLGQLTEGPYVEEFVYNYGEWHRALARDLWRGRAASGSDIRYFDWPLLKRVVERSRAVVVHNPAAAQTVRAHAPQAKIIEIPHLFAAPPLATAAEAIRFRQRLGIGPERFFFGAFGYLRESKRLTTVLDAFARVRSELPNVALLVAGQFVSRDLERATQPLLSGPGIVRLPHLPEREFWLAAAAVDACINLKYPAAGETSGIGIRFLGIGKPVLVTESLESSRLPGDVCLRIPSGPAEAESLRSHMLLLASQPLLGPSIGARAARYIAEKHSLSGAAELYWDVLRSVA
jgi:glycosyltransferase involved in cell wall biosynthesis